MESLIPSDQLDPPAEEASAIAIAGNDVEPKLTKKLNLSKWEDAHDMHVRIDISQVARLRKLRKNKTETEITGHEYLHRLREYYTKTCTEEFFEWTKQRSELTLLPKHANSLKDLITSSYVESAKER